MELYDIMGDLGKRKIRVLIHGIGFTDAATLEMNKSYCIFLDPVCFISALKLKDVLMHEEGHCATGCTHRASSPLDLIEKHEYKANRWAIEYYLPFDSLNSAMRKGFTQPWELADYFNVSEEAVKMAIKYYTERRGMKFKQEQP